MGPLISAGQRDRVRGYLDGVDVAFAGTVAGRPRLLGAADGRAGRLDAAAGLA